MTEHHRCTYDTVDSYYNKKNTLYATSNCLSSIKYIHKLWQWEISTAIYVFCAW